MIGFSRIGIYLGLPARLVRYMDVCILLTSEYPFFYGETFIENEIGILSKTFERVLCFANNPSIEDKPTRKVPHNVEVFSLNGISSSMRYPFYVLNGIHSRYKQFKISETNVKRIALCLYSRGRAQVLADRIIRILDKLINEKDNIIVYSYWFVYHAQAACIVASYFRDKNYNAHAVSRGHGYDVFWERNGLNYLPFQKEALKILDYLFPCSDNGTNYLSMKYPDMAGKIKTARLGTVDHGKSNITTQDKRVFVTCCNLKPLKRISLFAEAFVEVSKIYHNCKWVCIGEGEELSRIKEIVNGNPDTEVELMGRMKNEDIMQYYKTSGVTYFCNVSETEGVPVTVMEALSFGIPVIATDVGGTKEIVNEEVGFLIPKDISKKQLCDAMLRAISIDDAAYQVLRTKARERWEDMCAAEKNYYIWAQALKCIINNQTV